MSFNIVQKIDDRVEIRNVLLSVFDKTGLDALVSGLLSACPHVRFYSTGGTYKAVQALLGADAAKRLVSVSDYTGQPEMQGGLVKTLDFKIYLGLLGETYNAAHQADLQRTGAVAFDMVVANLYPFQKVVAQAGVSPEQARTNINIGGALSRHDIDLKFTAEGGEAWVDGLYMLNGSQHHDTHSIIDHTVPNCLSHQSYKGVLNDKSRAVFNGKVFVRENAHGTDAHQSNKNLLLSNDARVDTKPQLEIFNDDVKCSHGATVGQFEEEELFYLLTRGLPENLARNLLTYGFAEEIINKILIDDIKAELDGIVLNRLGTEME